MNLSFENGWTNIEAGYGNLINQIPNNWEIFWTPIGEAGFFNDKTNQNATINSVPEMVHKLNDQLPPDEQIGGENALILDGDAVYKIFAHKGIWRAGIRQVFETYPNAEITVTVPVLVSYEDVLNFDSDDFQLQVTVGNEEYWFSSKNDLPHKTWDYLELEGQADEEGKCLLEIKAGTIWSNSRGFFIDNIQVSVEPPLEVSLEEHLIRTARNAQVIDYNSLAAIERKIVNDGFAPYSQEKWETYDGVKYSIQGARDVSNNNQRVYYCEVPDWGNIDWMWQNQENNPNTLNIITKYSQRDTRWANEVLGENTGHDKTIGNWGCLLVAYNMQAVYLNLCNDTPDVFNQRCVDAGAFSGQYILGGALRTVFPEQVAYYGYLDRGDALNQKVKDYIDEGYPVPCRVDFKPNTPQWEQHWVLVNGYDGDRFIMVDSWTGKEGYVDEVYGIQGNDLLTGVFYKLKESTGQDIDVASFMVADPTAWRVVRHSSGSQEDVQEMSLGGGLSVRRKGSNGEWWQYSTNYAYLVHDTSPSPDSQGNERVYTLYKNGSVGAPKNPSKMKLGETWYETGDHYVQFRAKNGCRDLSENSGYAQNYCKLARYEQNHTFNSYGQNITLDEVIWLETSNGETQIYAKDANKVVGWIGWESSWGSSEIVELHWDRGVLTEEPNRYCSF